MKRSEIIFGALRVPIDFLMVVAAFWLAYYLRPVTDLIPGIQYHFRPELLPSRDEYLVLSVLSSFFLVILLAANRMYSLKNTHRFAGEFFRIVFWVSAWMMFIIAYYFLIVHQLFFSRIALAHIWFFTILFLAVSRALILSVQFFLLRFGIGKRRILILGAGTLAKQLYQVLKKDSHYQIIGGLSDRRESRPGGTLKIIGTYQETEAVIKKYRVEEVIQATQAISNEEASHLLSFCRYNQIKYHFIPDLVKLQRTNVEVQMFDSLPVVSLKATSLDGWGYVYKRIFDFMFSFLALIILIPLSILIALTIKLNSEGPVLFKSRRQFKDRKFTVYKFRSMVADAHSQWKDLLPCSERRGPLFKLKNDPRMTRVGRFLRKTSLDELPQLLNVLMGSMSLVGPRPHLPEEIQAYKSHHHQVFTIKPGMTGLSQISGRSGLDFEEEVKLDVYYIENWSPWLDMKIIARSIGVIFRADGT